VNRSKGEIFVVDDDPAVRETLSIVLTGAGYQVICFADGAALLAVTRKPESGFAILLDVNIPGRSGLDILKELHGEDYPRADLHDVRPGRYPRWRSTPSRMVRLDFH